MIEPRYLRNTWYVAALSEEIADRPLGRRILDEPLVFFRTENGALAALADRCPHRFVPLSLGRVQGNALECGYHGLQFGTDGVCVQNPHGKHVIPRGATVRSYPLVERFGLAWIWCGDPTRADQALIPDYGFLDDPSLERAQGAVTISGNYELVVDNLLDLSHIEYLHPMFSNPDGVAAHRTEFFQDGDTVVSNRWRPKATIPGALKPFWTSSSERADTRTNMRWTAPARLLHDVGATEIDSPIEEGFTRTGVHLITPETAFTSHYFWAASYNRRQGDIELREKMREMVNHIFLTQDEPMIAAQQQAMGTSVDLVEHHPVMLEPDEPATRARRILARLIAEEANAARALPAYSR